MTTRRVSAPPTQTHDDAVADPWWGTDDSLSQTGAFDILSPAAAPARPAPGRRRPARRKRPLVLRLLALPLTLVADGMRRSDRFRTLVRRFSVLVVLGCVIGGAVGIILVNNLVISRSAELGELDQERRDLQRDNAILYAETAKLSAPQVIMLRARKTLGMIESPTIPDYIYLEPCSHQLTAAQRAQAALATGASPSCAPRTTASAKAAAAAKKSAAAAATTKQGN